jgi:CubicO group peptidase (beta-lactamase class C family)
LDSLAKVVGTGSAAMLAIDSGILLPGTPVRDYLPELSSESPSKQRVQDIIKDFSQNSPEAMDSRASILHEIVTRASGMPMERFVAETLFEPLGIAARLQSGSMGFRGRDLAIFAQMLLNKGMYDHRRILKAEIIARYTGPQGLWSKPSGFDWMTPIASASAYGHFSQAGPFLWIDPVKQLFIVLMTTPSPAGTAVIEAQRRITESVLSEIVNYE